MSNWNDEWRLSNDELRHSVYFILYAKSPKPAPTVIPAEQTVSQFKNDALSLPVIPAEAGIQQ